MKFTWGKCPHCHKTLNFKSEGGAGTVESPIGKPGYFTCRFCSGQISNGKQEWKDLDFIDRASHLLRMVWTIFFWSAACGIGGAIIAHYLFDGYHFVFATIGSVGMALLIAYGTWKEIQESKKRTLNSSSR